MESLTVTLHRVSRDYTSGQMEESIVTITEAPGPETIDDLRDHVLRPLVLAMGYGEGMVNELFGED